MLVSNEAKSSSLSNPADTVPVASRTCVSR